MKKKKRFHFVRIVFSWGVFLFFLSVITPAPLFPFIGFYLILFLALVQTFQFFFTTLRSVLWSLGILLFLLLRQFGIATLSHQLLLFGILVLVELYCRKQ